MITTTRRLACDMSALEDQFITAIDEAGYEYIIEKIVKQQKHTDNPKEWYYALKIRSTGTGCIKN